jgi:addiction module HigA family antidote
MSFEFDDQRAEREYGDLPMQAPVHPGEHLLYDFLEPLGITQTKMAADLGIPLARVNEIIKGKRSVSAETALLLGRYFPKVGPQFWLNLQSRYDMEVAMRRMGERLAMIRPAS